MFVRRKGSKGMAKIRFHWGSKDGGPDSNSRIYGIEMKNWFSVLFMTFNGEGRTAYHDHAFNAVSWLICGQLHEYRLHEGDWFYTHLPSWRPILTPRTTFHRVEGHGEHNWVLTFRGKWKDTWLEFIPGEKRYRRLTHGRQEKS